MRATPRRRASASSASTANRPDAASLRGRRDVEAPDARPEGFELVLRVEVAHDEPHHVVAVEDDAGPSGRGDVRLSEGCGHGRDEPFLTRRELQCDGGIEVLFGDLGDREGSHEPMLVVAADADNLACVHSESTQFTARFSDAFAPAADATRDGVARGPPPCWTARTGEPVVGARARPRAEDRERRQALPADRARPTAEAGEIDLAELVTRTPEEWVADSGVWHLLAADSLPIADAAALIGAVSDNLATNVLVRRLGIEAIAATTRELGFERSALLDRVRDERLPEHPPTLSQGSAGELARLVAAPPPRRDRLAGGVRPCARLDGAQHRPLDGRRPPSASTRSRTRTRTAGSRCATRRAPSARRASTWEWCRPETGRSPTPCSRTGTTLRAIPVTPFWRGWPSSAGRLRAAMA